MESMTTTEKRDRFSKLREIVPRLLLLVLSGCATINTTGGVYRDPKMDFGQIQSIAVMPFGNLSRDTLAGDRVRDVFMTMLQGTGAAYVIPPGEISRGITRTGISTPATPAPEEVVRFAANVKADTVITGIVREYGETRSGSSSSNLISLSLQMMEAQTGKVVWTAASTKGGIGLSDRLFGGGGDPMNNVTEKAIDDLIDKLFHEK